MAKHSSDDPKQEEHPTHGHAATHAQARTGGTQYVVTFAGQQPLTVEAANPEEATKKAAEQLGVVSSEKPPEVVKVE
jgi:hypothetical protein